MAETISPIESYSPKNPQANRPDPMRDAAQRLYIRLPSRSCPQYAKVINLLEILTVICRSSSIWRTPNRSWQPRVGCTRRAIRSSLRSCVAWSAKRTLQQNNMSRNESYKEWKLKISRSNV